MKTIRVHINWQLRYHVGFIATIQSSYVFEYNSLEMKKHVINLILSLKLKQCCCHVSNA